MKRTIAATAVAAVAVGAGFAGSAIGQGTGGTVGPGAQGKLDLTVRATNGRGRDGINPAKGNAAAKSPRIMDITGGNADVVDAAGKVIGRTHSYDVITYRPKAKKYKGGAESLFTAMVDLGNNDVLWGHCRSSDDDRVNPCAIVGGSGKFAGARGTWTEDRPVETKTSQTIVLHITFIP